MKVARMNVHKAEHALMGEREFPVVAHSMVEMDADAGAKFPRHFTYAEWKPRLDQFALLQFTIVNFPGA